MAHIGHFGPVALRRDLNLNISSNDYGWPRRIIAFFRNMVGGPISVLQGHTFDLGPDIMAALAVEHWESLPYTKGITSWQAIFESTIVGGIKYQKDFYLSDFVAKKIVWHFRFADEIDGVPRPGWNSAPFTISYDPLYFDQKPNALEVFFRTKVWADGPPL